MISTLWTPLSAQRFFNSARYLASLALSLKNWLTYSTASMPNSALAIRGKSRLVIFLANRARCSDHSAREILNSGCFSLTVSAAPRPVSPSAAGPGSVEARKLRRSMAWIMGCVLESERGLGPGMGRLYACGRKTGERKCAARQAHGSRRLLAGRTTIWDGGLARRAYAADVAGTGQGVRRSVSRRACAVRGSAPA